MSEETAAMLREHARTLNLSPEKEALAEEWIRIFTGPEIVNEDNSEGCEIIACVCCEKEFYWGDGSWHKSKRICDECAKAAGQSWWIARSGERHPDFCTAEECDELRRWKELTRRYKGKATIPPELRWEVFERDNFTCRHCGGRRNLRADHIHPESKGGLMVLENLQTLCMSCNSRKGNRMPEVPA